ncbi:HTH_Tnp_Tc3_2 domain-containing protein [Trichonephila clavipes]|nr:HTH_Tnp_Tc3_2 domain-containing protein [Trichonephila clavipes]
MNTNTLNDRIIIRASTSSPTTSLVSVRRHLPLSRHPVASRETIRRWLADADLRNRRPLSHLPLICYHRQYPLDFFRPRASWNMTDWRWVIFSNESQFSLNADDQRICVWMRQATGPIRYSLSRGIR